jgi:hypothetical protein
MPVAAPEMAAGPMMEPTPPDARPQTLEELLMQADAMIWRDGGMDEEEMRVVRAWYEMQQQKIMAMAEQQAAGAQGGPAPAGNEEMDYTNGGDAAREDSYA